MTTFGVVVTLFWLSISVSTLEVKSPLPEVLPTHTSNLQYESIQFQKRARNDTVHLVLQFVVTGVAGDGYELSWQYSGQKLSVSESADGNVYMEKAADAATKDLTITLHLKNDGANAGNYSLTVSENAQSATGEAFVNSAPILPIYSKPKRVLQGDPLRISCRVSGYPTPQNVSWLFAPIEVKLSDDKAAINDASKALKPINLNDDVWKAVKIVNEDGTENDTLRIDSLAIAQNGLFACQTKNDLGKDSTFLLVAVKDRWAALWPFIGIVIEVTVLVAAILLYERHQVRSKPTTTAAVDANAQPANPLDGGAASPPTNGQVPEKDSKVADDVRNRNARA